MIPHSVYQNRKSKYTDTPEVVLLIAWLLCIKIGWRDSYIELCCNFGGFHVIHVFTALNLRVSMYIQYVAMVMAGLYIAHQYST